MSFPLYLDEDVAVQLAALLRQGGFDVLTTQEANRASQSLSDEDQLGFATQQGRAIFSHNAIDFEILAKEWAHSGQFHFGIIVSGRRSVSVLATGIRTLEESYPDGIANHFLRPPT